MLSHIKSKRKSKEQPYKKQEKQGKIRKTREKTLYPYADGGHFEN